MRLRRLGLCLLLSASVLGASTTPLALRHCHAECQRPHDGPLRPQAHACGHAHCQGHVAAASSSATACHLHLLWFGIEITMPSDHHERSHDPEQHLLCQVRLCEHEGLKRSPEGPHHGAPVDAAAQLPAPLAQQATVLCSPQFTFAPLCDVARRERTGVLRA